VDATIEFAGLRIVAAVFVNDAPVQGTDGYVGMGVLRAFDLLLHDDDVGVRRNGLTARVATDYAATANEGACPEHAAACKRK
jgi:hypothetical protein